jgi:hypothetical protein
VPLTACDWVFGWEFDCGGVAFAFAVAGGVEMPLGTFSAAGDAMMSGVGVEGCAVVMGSA